jgi:1-deoxy-D-xylulose-5-phosphate reductoisomerase
VLNAANEVAVEAFLAGRIRFPRIWELVAATMGAHSVHASDSLETLLAADDWARKFTRSQLP